LELSESEIIRYVDAYNPFDKAGSYGIQEWIGYAAVESIQGCFYNVMGLPASKVYQALKSFGIFQA
jgi:septum formation protein